MNKLDPGWHDVRKELRGDPGTNNEEPEASREKGISKVACCLLLALFVANNKENS